MNTDKNPKFEGRNPKNGQKDPKPSKTRFLEATGLQAIIKSGKGRSCQVVPGRATFFRAIVNNLAERAEIGKRPDVGLTLVRAVRRKPLILSTFVAFCRKKKTKRKTE